MLEISFDVEKKFNWIKMNWISLFPEENEKTELQKENDHIQNIVNHFKNNLLVCVLLFKRYKYVK